MSNEENVVSFRTKKPISVKQAVAEPSLQEEKEINNAEADKLYRQETSENLRKLADQFETGEMKNLLVIAGNEASGLFYEDISLTDNMTGQQIFAMTGIINAMSLEMASLAQMQPTINLDGEITDPSLAFEEMMEAELAEDDDL